MSIRSEEKQRTVILADSPETVYSSESLMRHPVSLARKICRDLVAYRELAARILIRDLRVRYRRLFLGVLWVFATPLATAIGLTVVNNANIIHLGPTPVGVPYPVYVLFSMALWQVFVGSVNAPIRALSASKGLLVKINFPPEAIVISKLGEVIFNFAVTLVLVAAFFAWFHVTVTWKTLLAPAGLLSIVVFGTAVGLCLSPLVFLLEDLANILNFILAVWLFITPVIYPVPTGGWIQTVVKLNPLTTLLVTTREWATIGVVSDGSGFVMVSLLSWTTLAAGWLVYRVSIPVVIER